MCKVTYTITSSADDIKIVQRRNYLIMVEDNGNGTASNAIWAVAMIIIVALIAGVLYFTVLKGGVPTPTKKVDVDVTIPAR